MDDHVRETPEAPAAGAEAGDSDPHGGQEVAAAGAPLAGADAVVLLIHGRGASPDDILELGRALVPDDAAALLAPAAAGGTWYPASFMAPPRQNEPWLSSALALVGRILDETSGAGIPISRTVVAGFSQGACLAAEFVARHPGRYGALLAFTGGLLGPPLTEFPHEGDMQETPVYLSAGDTDPHVPWRRMEATREVFERMRARVTLRRWPDRPHTIIEREITEARELLAPLFR